MKNKILLAREYALEKHGNQTYGDLPYVAHLDQVYDIVCELGLSEDYKIAAYLHDILEDTIKSEEERIKTKNEIIQNFSEHIYEMVYAVSGFGETREERQNDIKRKMHENPSSIDLKMCDRLANLRSSFINRESLYQRYCIEHEQLKTIFSQGNTELFGLIELEVSKNQKKRKMTL